MSSHSQQNILRISGALGALALIWVVAYLIGMPVIKSTQAQAPNTQRDIGDVFLGVGNGQYQVRAPDGTLKETLDDNHGGLTTGCAFSANGDLYATNIEGHFVDKYAGNDPHALSQLGSGYSRPEMVVFDAIGRVYVSNVNDGGISQFDANGNYLQTILPDTRVDYFDLAADQDTILYTQEGNDIKAVSISTGQSLPDFTTGTATHAYALRIIPPTNPQYSGWVLLADLSEVKLYDPQGTSRCT